MASTFRTSNSSSTQPKPTGTFTDRLTPAALQDFQSMQFPSSYAADVVIFSEKDPAQGIYVVFEGEVKLSLNSRDGRRLSLTIARKGDILGMASTLAGGTYDVTAETLYPAKVAHILRRDLLDFLTRHPEAYQAVVEELSRSVTKACEQLRTVGLSATAPEKLARLLLDWSDNGQATECGGRRFRFSMTHEEIGEFIGASRETVTRTLSIFKLRRLVNFKGSMIFIPSRSALANYAHA